MVKINSLFVIALALVALNPASSMPLDKRAPQNFENPVNGEGSGSVKGNSGTGTITGTETNSGATGTGTISGGLTNDGKLNGFGKGQLTIPNFGTFSCDGLGDSRIGDIPDGSGTCEFTPDPKGPLEGQGPGYAKVLIDQRILTFAIGFPNQQYIGTCSFAAVPDPTKPTTLSGCTVSDGNGNPIFPPSGSTGSSTNGVTGLTSALSGAQSGVKDNAKSVPGTPSNAANADKVTGTTTKSNASSSPSTISRR